MPDPKISSDKHFSLWKNRRRDDEYGLEARPPCVKEPLPAGCVNTGESYDPRCLHFLPQEKKGKNEDAILFARVNFSPGSFPRSRSSPGPKFATFRISLQ